MDKNYNFLDFIEIGTSDFDTEIQKKDKKRGISIEPIKYYLDKLPDKENCIKIESAISDNNNPVKIYYISEENIKKYKFPLWFKGCNSINNYHPTVQNYLNNKNIKVEDVITNYEVPCSTLNKVIDDYKIDGIYYLKIDTEGHDIQILFNFIKNIKDNKFFPHNILFESNKLSNAGLVIQMIELLKSIGYELIYQGNDTRLSLNLKKIKNKSKFTESIRNYYIIQYPINYDINNLPHENTLEGAKKYCIENNCSGITYQYNRYEVRDGYNLYYYDDNNLQTWIYL